MAIAKPVIIHGAGAGRTTVPLSYPSDTTRGTAPIGILLAGTTAADTIVWALRNSVASSTIYIPKIRFQPYFAGTGAATEQLWDFWKYTAATAFGNSPTAITPIAKRTSLTAGTGVAVGVKEAGFTLTNGVAAGLLHTAAWQRVTHAATQTDRTTGDLQVIDFGDQPLELAANECLVIRVDATGVIGDGLTGSVDFFG